MYQVDLTASAAQIEAKIAQAGPCGRTQYQPELSRIVQHMRASGVRVPSRLRKLDMVLTEEAIEDMFDNMPV